MSDTKLRDLERRWQETGAVEDEVAYFTERVRAGDLSEDRIRLATYLGNEAPPTLTGVVEPPGPLQEWLAGLRQWSVEALARGVIAATSEIAARTTATTESTYRCPYENRPIPPLGCDSCLTGPRYGALAAQEWLLNKTEKHRLHLQHQLWFPEFETDAIHQAVRRELMPWVLGPGPHPVEEHLDHDLLRRDVEGHLLLWLPRAADHRCQSLAARRLSRMQECRTGPAARSADHPFMRTLRRAWRIRLVSRAGDERSCLPGVPHAQLGARVSGIWDGYIGPA